AINIDLMPALPRQRVADAIGDLEHAFALGTTHLSWYQLTLEPRTPFAANPPPLPDEQTLGDIEEAGLRALNQAGFGRYEVSAFAKDGAIARHNVNYWQFGDYLGIGAGAHGKLTFAAEDRIVRTTKPLQPRRYLAALPAELCSTADVSRDARPGEFMLNTLRLVDGVSCELFENRTGL